MPPSLRLIQDTLYDGSGAPASGTLEISWATGTTPDGFTLAQGKLMVTVTSGKVSVSIVPGTYTVVYHVGPAHQKETWVVPATAGPFTIAQIKQ